MNVKLIIIGGVLVLIGLFGIVLSMAGTKADRDYGRDDEAGRIPPAR